MPRSSHLGHHWSQNRSIRGQPEVNNRKILILFVNSGQREPVRTEPVRTTSSQFGPQASQFGPDLVQTGSRRPWIDPASQFGPCFFVCQFEVRGQPDFLSYLCFTTVLLNFASQFGPLVRTGSHKVVRTGSFRKSWVSGK